MSEPFKLPEWPYDHRFGSDIEAQAHLLPQENMLMLGYLRNKYARVWRTGKTWLACFEGGHREGKSWAAQLIAAILDKTFLADRPNRIVHGHQAFMEKVREIDAKKIYGAVIICDEAGAVGNFSSAEWQKEWMAAINSVMQILGYLHLIILFIAPDKAFIDSKTRRMFHDLHKVSRPNNDYSVVKPYHLRWNQMKKKYDEVSPSIKIGNARMKLRSFRIRHYPKELGEAYQLLEEVRKPQMLDALDKKATASQAQHARRTFDYDALAVVVYEDVKKNGAGSLYQTKRSKTRAIGDSPTIDKAMVKMKLGVPVDGAQYIKSVVENRFEAERKKAVV